MQYKMHENEVETNRSDKHVSGKIDKILLYHSSCVNMWTLKGASAEGNQFLNYVCQKVFHCDRQTEYGHLIKMIKIGRKKKFVIRIKINITLKALIKFENY